MRTWVAQTRTKQNQKREQFTGEGAYHGSTRRLTETTKRPLIDVVSEARPTTLERYIRERNKHIRLFNARFTNRYQVNEQLPIPSQKDVRDDRVTFCWCPFEEALRLAGPVTRGVLHAMGRHISDKKRYVYIDSKIQYFRKGDLPVDSMLWHVDGSIAVRDERVQQFDTSILHDMRARFDHDEPPLYTAYQSSTHCATQFLDRPLELEIPELIPNFNGLDTAVRAARVAEVEHPAGAIVSFDGLALHTAVPASTSGWRLWIRCTQTNVKIVPNESILDCYNTVFQHRN